MEKVWHVVTSNQFGLATRKSKTQGGDDSWSEWVKMGQSLRCCTRSNAGSIPENMMIMIIHFSDDPMQSMPMVSWNLFRCKTETYRTYPTYHKCFPGSLWRCSHGWSRWWLWRLSPWHLCSLGALTPWSWEPSCGVAISWTFGVDTATRRCLRYQEFGLNCNYLSESVEKDSSLCRGHSHGETLSFTPVKQVLIFPWELHFHFLKTFRYNFFSQWISFAHSLDVLTELWLVPRFFTWFCAEEPYSAGSRWLNDSLMFDLLWLRRYDFLFWGVSADPLHFERQRILFGHHQQLYQVPPNRGLAAPGAETAET